MTIETDPNQTQYSETTPSAPDRVYSDRLVWQSYLGLLTELGIDALFADDPIDRLKPPIIAPTKSTTDKKRDSRIETRVDSVANLDVNVNPTPTVSTAIDLNSACKEAELIAQKTTTIEAVYEALEQFEPMPLRKEGGNRLIRASGQEGAPLFVLTEAPMPQLEEAKLIERFIKALGFEGQAFICPCVFWQPAGNRPLNETDLRLSAPFVKAMVTHNKPKAILVLGAQAGHCWLGERTPMAKLRTTQIDHQLGDDVIPLQFSYAVSFLLKQPLAKAQLWHDGLRLKQRIDTQNLLVNSEASC